MHEVAIANAILGVVCRYAPDHSRAAAVRSVHVRVGEKLPVTPDLLARCFYDVVRDTPYCFARVAIQTVPGVELTVRDVEVEDPDRSASRPVCAA